MNLQSNGKCRRIAMSGMRRFFHISIVFGLALLSLADDSSRQRLPKRVSLDRL